MSLFGRVMWSSSTGMQKPGPRWEGRQTRKRRGSWSQKSPLRLPSHHMCDQCTLTWTLSAGETAWNTKQNTGCSPRGSRKNEESQKLCLLQEMWDITWHRETCFASCVKCAQATSSVLGPRMRASNYLFTSAIVSTWCSHICVCCWSWLVRDGKALLNH